MRSFGWRPRRAPNERADGKGPIARGDRRCRFVAFGRSILWFERRKEPDTDRRRPAQGSAGRRGALGTVAVSSSYANAPELLGTVRSEGGSMSQVNREDSGSPQAAYLTMSWQVGLFVGLVTLALGIVVTLHPSTSINVIAVLLGVLLLIGGVFHLIRALDHSAPGRAWSAVIGLAFVILGVVLIRHLDVTRNLIALFIGIVWIIQGIAELLTSADPDRPGRAWSIVFGLVSLAAGIVVLAVPTGSLNALALLLGIWFIVIGALQVIGAFYVRHELKKAG